MLGPPTTGLSVTTASTTTPSPASLTTSSAQQSGLSVQTVSLLTLNVVKSIIIYLVTQCPNPSDLNTDVMETVQTYTESVNYTSLIP